MADAPAEPADGRVANACKQDNYLPVLVKSAGSNCEVCKKSVNMEEVLEGTKGCLVFDAKVSKTIQFIAEKPLRNLFNTMAEKLANHYEQ